MSVRRPVTANERIYLAGKQAFSDIIIQLFVEGEGEIPQSQLQEAVNSVALVFPGTRLRLEKSHWVADAAPPLVVCLDALPDLGRGFQYAVENHGPMDPANGRTCEVALASDGQRSFVAFRALHAIMDGRGLELWAKAVFTVLRGESPVAADAMLADDQYTQDQKAPLRHDEPMMPQQAGPTSSRPSEYLFRFDYGHYSLHGNIAGIVAKLSMGIRSLLLQNSTEKGCIMVPVDLRQDMPVDAPSSTANLSLPLFIPLEKQQSWQEFSSIMLTKLQQRRFVAKGRSDWLYRLMPVSLLGSLLSLLWKIQTAKGKYLMSAVVSHTGRQCLKDYSAAPFRACRVLFVPCAIPVAPLSLIITETESSTDICLVKGQCLWGDPQDLLAKLIDAAGLGEHAGNEMQASSAATKDVSPLSAYQEVTYPDAHLGLHQLFERQVSLTPNNICIAFKEKNYTYSDINVRANQLAHYLIALGVQRGDFVGVGLERSVDLIVAILAALKSGGAYLPLDPTLPDSRLAYMVTDSSARLVVSRAVYSNYFGNVDALICLDNKALQLEKQRSDNPDVYSSHEDVNTPCYLIYTSGSTGNPKGTINAHHGVVNHFLYLQSRFDFGEDDVTFQKTPISFDASMLEIFLPLFSGGRLAITEPEAHKDARYLRDKIQSEGVTFISIIPSVLNSLLDEMQGHSNEVVRLLLVGGELFSDALYKKVKAGFPNAVICNLYGPAEAAIDSLLFIDDEGFSSKSVPIGKPIANMEAFVVNQDLERIAPGGKGELLIAGTGVGLGYLNRAELTGEKYLEHPFRPELSSIRAYRTGDIVRQLPEGNYEYLGRVDHQVKIQGVRIEPGEIEHLMQSLPAINQAAVIQADVHGRATLVGCFTLHPGSLADDNTNDLIRQELKHKLPAYMIPGRLVALESMPLNTSGKLDRIALMQIVALKMQVSEPQRAMTDKEKQIASVWADVLGEDIDLASDFFELGGNSMLAIRLVRKINELLGKELHAQSIYENSSFSSFSLLVL